MKLRNKVLLGLMALILMFGLGAKMYSCITMGDGEWIGLAADAGRIVFDNQVTDEVQIEDAKVTISSDAHEALRLSTTSSASPYISFYQATTRRSFIQHNDTNDNLKVVSEYGQVSIWTGAGGTEVERVTVQSGGNVGIKDATPSYDLDVNGDIRATDDVFVNDDLTVSDNVFIGSAEDADEDGARMYTRADNGDGGYVFWVDRNNIGGVTVIFESDGNGGDTGPDMVLWVQWLVKDNDTGFYTEGDAILIEGQTVTIATDGNRDYLWLEFETPTHPDTKGRVFLNSMGSHVYDIVLLIMWVED